MPTPTQTDPDKYTVVLENERVRVFRYHDTPGAKTRLHHHEAFVLYVLAPFKRRLIFADGSTKEREFKAGDVIYMDAQNHAGENIGKTDTEVLIVELKEPGAKPLPSDGWKTTAPKK
ncbi:MAG: cytoplasmic protein [Archangiaceae bacterium]|nr:cytoplasmic protein [Archangiaceae bacterium]